MQHLAAADYVRTRWKNGAGETMQVAVFPAHAGLNDFIWRISIATIAADGAFSLFSGIDRTIMALAGAGCVLRLGDQTQTLRPGDPPYAFSGDGAAEASLLAGPVTDFNVMTRRGVARHRLADLMPGGVISRGPDIAMVFALTTTNLRSGSRHIALGQWDLLTLDPDETVTLLDGNAMEIRITLVAGHTGRG